MYVAVVLSILVGVALAQKPEPCYSPNQWECREIRVDRSQNYEERRRLSYDAINRRERKLAEIELGSTRNFYDILTLHNEDKEYILDLKTRKCNTTRPSRPFYHRGVVPGARFDYEFTLGATGIAGESIVVKAFSANTTTESYFGLVTSPDCFPVQNIHLTKEYGLEESTYFDLTVGITDPMAFIPPSECTP